MSTQVAADLRAAADAGERRDWGNPVHRLPHVRSVVEPLVDRPFPVLDADVHAALRAAADKADQP